MSQVFVKGRVCCQAMVLPGLQARHTVFSAYIAARTVMLFFLVLFVTGCGFHLRGNIEMPAFLTSIYIKDEQVSRITPVLQQYLKTNDVKLMSDAASANAVLAIDGERFDRRVLSVDSAGKVQEYALLYSVQFSLFDQSHQPLLSQQKIQVERDMRFDPTQVLAKSSEEAQLNQDMLQDAGQQIMRRIQFVKSAAQ